MAASGFAVGSFAVGSFAVAAGSLAGGAVAHISGASLVGRSAVRSVFVFHLDDLLSLNGAFYARCRAALQEKCICPPVFRLTIPVSRRVRALIVSAGRSVFMQKRFAGIF